MYAFAKDKGLNDFVSKCGTKPYSDHDHSTENMLKDLMKQIDNRYIRKNKFTKEGKTMIQKVKRYGEKTGAEYLTFCVDEKFKAFESKWYPKVEFDGKLVLIQENNEFVNCDSEKEAVQYAKEYLEKMKVKYPEDFVMHKDV